jgi:hypothetical protein
MNTRPESRSEAPGAYELLDLERIVRQLAAVPPWPSRPCTLCGGGRDFAHLKTCPFILARQWVEARP